MGQPFEGTGSTGYDNISGKYVSLWRDSMSTAVMEMFETRDGAETRTMRIEYTRVQ